MGINGRHKQCMQLHESLHLISTRKWRRDFITSFYWTVYVLIFLTTIGLIITTTWLSKKAVYKPAAFFKGILLPLRKDKNCTLREAAIVASVLQRVSIPVHHSAVAIHKLAQLEYCGAASLFIKTLLNKKYSLPSPVIATLVKHFSCFLGKNDVLPVLWHQCLLVFVQRYKNEVQDEARESLRLLMKKHFHHKITPEIRRELFGAQAWKEERALMLDDAPNMET